ncbi:MULTISPECIES: TniB family NTP-binding protein [Dyella]|uniref:AAA family ATPase n=2 Tax=Dyella TaxID=231454 RepID=A0A4R0YUN2_9GAMM|nr:MULTISPECIES: TniB family NTP-binding protein [Dyella]TBR39401.1 hypothetical protein EYV96_04060 [Dyella terrae]TCI13012.1 hypothetical protein EZM97_06805 [Dyella soli]
MATTYSHLLSSVIDALEWPVELRVRDILERRFIAHERINAIFKYIDYLMFRPTRTRTAGLVVVGAPGAGKTDLLEQLRDRYPESSATRETIAKRPTLLFSMCGVREARGLYVRMLVAFGHPNSASYTGREREQLVLIAARACGLRLLLVDEIQDVLNGTRQQQRATLESLRFLMNELRIVIVLAGSEEAELAIKMDEHLRARLRLKRLPCWRADGYLAHFLEAMESTLPLRLPSRLNSEGTMKLIVRLTGGQTDAIVTLVGNAAALAVMSGGERITPSLLERAVNEFPELCATELATGTRHD